jgi:hypothetical protein
MKRSKDVKPEPENDDDPNRPLLSFVIVSHIHGSLFPSTIEDLHSSLASHQT